MKQSWDEKADTFVKYALRDLQEIESLVCGDDVMKTRYGHETTVKRICTLLGMVDDCVVGLRNIIDVVGHGKVK